MEENLSSEGPLTPSGAFDRHSAGVDGITLDGGPLTPGEAFPHDPVWRVAARRCVTIPALFAATALHTLLLPVLIPTGIVLDLARGRRQRLLRFHLIVATAFWLHIIGGVGLLGLWLFGFRWLGYRPRAWTEWNLALEGWWVGLVFGAVRQIYGVRLKVEGAEQIHRGPVVMLSRHVSILDTLLPILVFTTTCRMQMRIVKKRELLFDPCVESIGRRVPSAFVERGAGNTKEQADNIARLLDGVGPRDAVVIFPEGTRFSSKKRLRVISKLREEAPEDARNAEQLQALLPIRPGGALALLAKRPDVDVVFCGHVGLESASKLADFVDGALIDTTVKIRYWRVPATEVPTDPHARIKFLNAWWMKVDRWVIDNSECR